MSGRFELGEFEVGNALDNVHGPSDYAHVAATNADLVERLEGVIVDWCKEIDQVCYLFS